MLYLPLSFSFFIFLLLHNFVIFLPQFFYSHFSLLLLISIVFPTPPPPPPPPIYCFPSTTTTTTATFLLFSLHHHIFIVFPPPPHFYCFSSTTTTTTTTTNDVFISGYEIVRRDRSVRGADGKMYGGVSFYVRSSINFSLRTDLSIDQLEIYVSRFESQIQNLFSLRPGIAHQIQLLISSIFSKRLLGKWMPKMSSFICWGI